MTNAYLDLARRCEEASGPDRELDGLIEVARDPMRETILYNKPGRFPQEAVRGPIKDLVLSGSDLADYINAPRYTASLDAAMSLVPEGWFKYAAEDEHGCHACVWSPDRKISGGCKDSATPALALCAASLRAKGAGENEL